MARRSGGPAASTAFKFSRKHSADTLSDGQHPRAPKDTPGFTQTYQNIGGKTVTVEPFLIGPDQNANVLDSVDHSHVGMEFATVAPRTSAVLDQCL
jgi:hypothetical protein